MTATTALPPPQPSGPSPGPDPQAEYLRWFTAGPPDAATRHLSAGGYLDEEFCRTAVLDVRDDERRLVAPSYGFDLPTVLHHCVRARWSYLIRDIVLTGALLLTLLSLVGIPAFIFAAFALGALRYLTAFCRLVADIARQIRTREYQGTSRSLLQLGVFAVVSLVAVPLVIALLMATASVTLAAALTGPSTDPGGAAIAMVFALGFLLLVLFGVTIGSAVWRQLQLDRLAPSPAPTPAPEPTARSVQLTQQSEGNVTVFGGDRPFIGSGTEVAKWGLACRLVRADQAPPRHATADAGWEGGTEFDQPPFDITELVNYVSRRLDRLRYDQTPEHHLAGLTVESRVFLAGTEVAGLHPKLPDRDVTQIMRHPTVPARHYLACRVVGWRGELVTHVYLHFAAQGKALYTEFVGYALAPCREEFRAVDTFEGTGTVAHVRAVWRAFLDTPDQVFRAPINCVRAILDVLANGARRAAPTSSTTGYDRGAQLSIRELGAGPLAVDSLQFHDVAKFVRIIERQAVALVYEFLESRGVDITEYRQRFVNILNNGVWNNGSMSMGGGNAFGPGAQTTNTAGTKP